LDQAVLFHPQQSHPGTHRFGLPQGVEPAQVLAEPTRQRRPAQGRFNR
jgi:hypothetical protein